MVGRGGVGLYSSQSSSSRMGNLFFPWTGQAGSGTNSQSAVFRSLDWGPSPRMRTQQVHRCLPSDSTWAAEVPFEYVSGDLRFSSSGGLDLAYV